MSSPKICELKKAVAALVGIEHCSQLDVQTIAIDKSADRTYTRIKLERIFIKVIHVAMVEHSRWIPPSKALQRLYAMDAFDASSQIPEHFRFFAVAYAYYYLDTLRGGAEKARRFVDMPVVSMVPKVLSMAGSDNLTTVVEYRLFLRGLYWGPLCEMAKSILGPEDDIGDAFAFILVHFKIAGHGKRLWLEALALAYLLQEIQKLEIAMELPSIFERSKQPLDLVDKRLRTSYRSFPVEREQDPLELSFMERPQRQQYFSLEDSRPSIALTREGVIADVTTAALRLLPQLAGARGKQVRSVVMCWDRSKESPDKSFLPKLQDRTSGPPLSTNFTWMDGKKRCIISVRATRVISGWQLDLDTYITREEPRRSTQVIITDGFERSGCFSMVPVYRFTRASS